MLNKCDGPECPYCGCNDTKKAEFLGRWGLSLTKWQCNHCGSTFTVREREADPPASSGNGHHVIDETQPKLIVYPLIRCPVNQEGCGSTNTKVARTKRPIRYHKCQDCGKSFKSVEEGSDP
jgi:transposase-like protein